MDFLNHREGPKRGYGFPTGFPPFFFTETVRGCVSLKKWKSQARQSKAVEVTGNNNEENLQTFVWISSKNSASGPYDARAVL